MTFIRYVIGFPFLLAAIALLMIASWVTRDDIEWVNYGKKEDYKN
jgi:hypothetical protein